MSDHNFYQNLSCPYYPCNLEVPAEQFNCFFCYCPLFSFQCPGDYNLSLGFKDCSACKLNKTVAGADLIEREVIKIYQWFRSGNRQVLTPIPDENGFIIPKH